MTGGRREKREEEEEQKTEKKEKERKNNVEPRDYKRGNNMGVCGQLGRRLKAMR